MRTMILLALLATTGCNTNKNHSDDTGSDPGSDDGSYQDGYDDGFKHGEDAGWWEGRERGYDEGREDYAFPASCARIVTTPDGDVWMFNTPHVELLDDGIDGEVSPDYMRPMKVRMWTDDSDCAPMRFRNVEAGVEGPDWLEDSRGVWLMSADGDQDLEIGMEWDGYSLYGMSDEDENDELIVPAGGSLVSSLWIDARNADSGDEIQATIYSMDVSDGTTIVHLIVELEGDSIKFGQ